jgi:hypothetical protein
MWFAVELTVPASTLAGTSLLDQLAAAFAEDPERVGELLLGLHALNMQTENDKAEGDDAAADESAGQAMAARESLAKVLPVDVQVHLKEREARDLSEGLLAAARRTFKARLTAGFDPEREAAPLATAGRRVA